MLKKKFTRLKYHYRVCVSAFSGQHIQLNFAQPPPISRHMLSYPSVVNVVFESPFSKVSLYCHYPTYKLLYLITHICSVILCILENLFELCDTRSLEYRSQMLWVSEAIRFLSRPCDDGVNNNDKYSQGPSGGDMTVAFLLQVHRVISCPSKQDRKENSGFFLYCSFLVYDLIKHISLCLLHPRGE